MTEPKLDLLHLRATSAAGRAWDAALQAGCDDASGIAWVALPCNLKHEPFIDRLRRVAGSRTIQRANGSAFYRILPDALINGPLVDEVAPQRAACAAYCAVLTEEGFEPVVGSLSR